VSHPIPLHTAERLERALEASSRCVAARGAKGWVMRIVAYFACQYARAVIELLEGLLAEYRAGTLVLPNGVEESFTTPAEHEAGKPRTAMSRAQGTASRRVRAPGRVPAPGCVPAHDPCDDNDADTREQGAAPPRRMEFNVAPPRLPIRHAGHGPRGVAWHPSVVPRTPVKNSRTGARRLSTPRSLRYRDENRRACVPLMARWRATVAQSKRRLAGSAFLVQ
jgi:hypothetical protein